MDIKTTDTDGADLAKRTFDELQVPGFRPLRDVLLVRTNPMPLRTGSIFLPNKLTSFYGELPHMQPITAIVLTAGPKAVAKPGDQIAFMRLHFIRWETLEDKTVAGWISEANVFGWADLDPGDTFADLRVVTAPRPAPAP